MVSFFCKFARFELRHKLNTSERQENPKMYRDTMKKYRDAMYADRIQYDMLDRYVYLLIKTLVYKAIEASGHPVKWDAISVMIARSQRAVYKQVFGVDDLMDYIQNTFEPLNTKDPLAEGQLEKIKLIVAKAVTDHIAKDIEFQKNKQVGRQFPTNGRRVIGNKESMRRYWWGQPREHQHILFCKTSDGLLLHVPQEHLLKAVQQNKSVVLKRWPLIEGKNGKEEEEAERTTLPLEVLSQILQNSSEPTPGVRTWIFSLVKGSLMTALSKDLADPELIWRWYEEIFYREPPPSLNVLWEYYVLQRDDLNAFVRKWYAGFVREYDMQNLGLVYDNSGLNALSSGMTELRLYLIMTLLRQKTIGTGSRDSHTVSEYLSVEPSIADARHKLMASGVDVKTVLRNVLTFTVLDLMNPNEDEEFTKLYKGWLKATKELDQKWIKDNWVGSEPQKWIKEVWVPMQAATEKAIRIIRGIGEKEAFSDKDFVAMLWLVYVSLNIVNGDSLETALKVGNIDRVNYVGYFISKLRKIVFFRVNAMASKEDYKEYMKKRILKNNRVTSQWVLRGGMRKPHFYEQYEGPEQKKKKDTEVPEKSESEKQEEEEEEEEERIWQKEKRDQRRRDKRRYERDREYKRLLQEDKDKRRQKREGMSSSSTTAAQMTTTTLQFWN